VEVKGYISAWLSQPNVSHLIPGPRQLEIAFGLLPASVPAATSRTMSSCGTRPRIRRGHLLERRRLRPVPRPSLSQPASRRSPPVTANTSVDDLHYSSDEETAQLIGGSSEFDPASLTGLTSEEVEAQIPSN